MRKLLFAPLFVFLSFSLALPVGAQPASTPELQEAALTSAVTAAQKVIRRGPQAITLADQATLNLPEGFGYIPPVEAGSYLRALGNTPDESLSGLIVPVGQQAGDWFVVINYVPSGYIKDDDAKEWNAGELLESIRAGTQEDNKQRVQMGIPEMEIIGWVEQPAYDEKTKRLVWSVSSRSTGQLATAENGINYNTYALGREGYYSLNLVTGLNTIARDKVAAHSLLAALHYKDGKRYEDFDASTDKVAEYGLAALVAGVAAKKLGFLAMIALAFAKFWKLILIGLVGVGLIGKKMLARKSG